jgi:hypothetical protein
VEQTQKSWMGRVKAMPRKVVTALIAQVTKRYKQLKNRYGPRYTKGMVAAALFTLFVPIPGISLLAVALVVTVAEIHRAISRRDSLRKTRAKELVLSMNGDAILQWSATPEELTNLGIESRAAVRRRQA